MSSEWPYPVAAAIVATAAGMFVGAPALNLKGFPLDDAWIFQVVARNLAETGVWGFIPGQPSSGATSILWTLVLSANHRLLGVDPVAFTWAVNVTLLAGSTFLLYCLIRYDHADPLGTALLAATPAFLGNYAWLAASGMESLLFAFLSVLAVFLWRRLSPWAGVVCALLVLTRPEAVGLPLILTAHMLSSCGKKRSRDFLQLWGPVAAAIAGSVALSLTTSGGILPSTMEGRRWLYRIDGPSFHMAWDFARNWGIRLTTIALGWPRWLAPALAVVILLGTWRAARRLPGLATLCAWALAVDVLYAVVLPVEGHGGRYQPLNLLLAPVLATLGLAELAGWVIRKPHAVQARLAVSAVAVALACLPSTWAWRGITAAGVDHINQVHVAIAGWVREKVPAQTPVAAFDIGAMGYFSKHRVVDLGGLVDRAYLPYLRGGKVPTYLQENGLSLVVLPSSAASGAGADLGRRLGITKAKLNRYPLAEFEGSSWVWPKTFAATTHASPRLVLYQIFWPGPPGQSR
jgi:hypothetical protein